MTIANRKPIPEERDAQDHLEQILKKATKKQASDIHLKAGLPPIVRINGRLFYLRGKGTNKLPGLTIDDLNAIVHSLMRSHQAEQYEAGNEVDLGYEIKGSGRFRINVCQQRGEPRIVCRHIPEEIPTIQELHLPHIVQKLAQLQRGLILVTGATGSGKSTTLAAVIDFITRTRSCHIVTIEDPIEFLFKDRKSIVTQRQVGLDTPSFTQALKYALRQDPDVILVGEIRDEETIRMALSAAETGHLVLATLHTSDAGESINRIIGSVSDGMQGQARIQLAYQLMGVVSQRLLSRKDKRGRIPAVEVLIHNRRVQEAILDSHRTGTLKDIIEESRSFGMQSFDQSLMDLVHKELITHQEALLHCTHSRDFQLKLDGVSAGQYTTDMREDAEHIQNNLANKFADLSGIELDVDESEILQGNTDPDDKKK